MKILPAISVCIIVLAILFGMIHVAGMHRAIDYGGLAFVEVDVDTRPIPFGAILLLAGAVGLAGLIISVWDEREK